MKPFNQNPTTAGIHLPVGRLCATLQRCREFLLDLTLSVLVNADTSKAMSLVQQTRVREYFKATADQIQWAVAKADVFFMDDEERAELKEELKEYKEWLAELKDFLSFIRDEGEM